MTDKYDGDPAIIITEDGADFQVVGGQPLMDTGLENHSIISMMTVPGWWGNDLEQVANRKINSKWIGYHNQSVTRQSLIDTARAAESDLKPGNYFGDIKALATNPVSQEVLTEIQLKAPSGDVTELALTQQGINWINQKNNPAHEQITE